MYMPHSSFAGEFCFFVKIFVIKYAGEEEKNFNDDYLLWLELFKVRTENTSEIGFEVFELAYS